MTKPKKRQKRSRKKISKKLVLKSKVGIKEKSKIDTIATTPTQVPRDNGVVFKVKIKKK